MAQVNTSPESQWLRIEVPEDTAKKMLFHATCLSASALSFSGTVYHACHLQEIAHHLLFHTALCSIPPGGS